MKKKRHITGLSRTAAIMSTARTGITHGRKRVWKAGAAFAQKYMTPRTGRFVHCDEGPVLRACVEDRTNTPLPARPQPNMRFLTYFPSALTVCSGLGCTNKARDVA